MENETTMDATTYNRRKSFANLVSDHSEQTAETVNYYIEERGFPWKYDEGKILADIEDYLKSTYGEHYTKNDSKIQCFDAWIALGDSGPTFRNTAMKYLWRYGSKGGKNKKDLLKALHYILLMLHVDHYNGEK